MSGTTAFKLRPNNLDAAATLSELFCNPNRVVRSTMCLLWAFVTFIFVFSDMVMVNVIDTQSYNPKRKSKSMLTDAVSGDKRSLIAFFNLTVQHYEARVRAGLPLVEENFPRLQWANFLVWGKKNENRSHFRSHHPLYTLQTLWDHADYHFQILGPKESQATSYDPLVAAKIPSGAVVFVNQVWKKWIDNILIPNITANNLTLILFDGDDSFCDGAEARRLREIPNIERIFAANACPHPKVVPLPLGVEDNLEFPLSKDWTFHGDELKVSRFFLQLQQQFQFKKSGIFCDMNVGTNPIKRSLALGFCQRLLESNHKNETDIPIAMGSLVQNKGRKAWDSYLTTMAQYQFVVSPEGNGFDCHRTWEALLVGSIPIVQHNNKFGNGVWEGLPVLIVNAWEDINATLLEEEWHKFELARAAGKFHYEKLFAPYWINRIQRGAFDASQQIYPTFPEQRYPARQRRLNRATGIP